MALQDLLTDDSSHGDDPHRRAIKLRKWIYVFAGILGGLHFDWIKLGSLQLGWLSLTLTELVVWRMTTLSLALVLALYLLSLAQVAVVFDGIIEGRAFKTKRLAVTEMQSQLEALRERRERLQARIPQLPEASFSGPPSMDDLESHLYSLDRDIEGTEIELRNLQNRDLGSSPLFLRLESTVEALRLVPPLFGAYALLVWGYVI